jgi:hypothetical protein
VKTSTADTPSTKRRGEGNRWAGVGLPPQYQTMLVKGRVLPDDHTAQECGISDNMFVQVFIRPTFPGR